MRLVVLLLVLAVAAPRNAAACPPGPCNKYRTMRPAVEAQVQTYWRAVRALPPSRFDRRAIEAFLAGSSWTPVSTLPATAAGTIAPRTLRFIAADSATRASTTDRVALLRAIERRAGTVYVEIDGVFYTLDRCVPVDGRVAGACLIWAGELPDGTIMQEQR